MTGSNPAGKISPVSGVATRHGSALNTQVKGTLTGDRIMVRHLIELIDTIKLAELKVRDVDFATGKLAKRLSTRSVRLARMTPIQAIRNAMVNDLVVRNVADLAAVLTGMPGRPSRSLNLEQAFAVPDAAKGERLWPYVAVSMLGGIRTEEARDLSLRSDSGVPIKQIADGVGHASTRTTEVVYRHQLRPVTRTAAMALGPLAESKGKTDGGQN